MEINYKAKYVYKVKTKGRGRLALDLFDHGKLGIQKRNRNLIFEKTDKLTALPYRCSAIILAKVRLRFRN